MSKSSNFICFGSKPKFVEHEPYTLNSGAYMVERGTFIPLKQQLEELKRAGVDLEAHRRAHSDYLAGETVNLDEPFVDYRDLDEFDVDAKRDFFLRQEILNQKLYEAKKVAEAEELARYRQQAAAVKDSPKEES